MKKPRRRKNANTSTTGTIKLLSLCALVALGTWPGQGEKFISATTNGACFKGNSNTHFNLRPIRLISPPTFRKNGEDFIEPLYGYQGEEAINQSSERELNLIGASGINRMEAFYHSPILYFLEQKLNSALQQPRHSQKNFISRYIDRGNESLREHIINYPSQGNPYFFARHVERSPITFISASTTPKDHTKCANNTISDILILHRGPNLRWGKAASIFVKRENVDFVFHPKLQTLLSRLLPRSTRKHYFAAEESQGILISLSAMDTPLWARGLALMAAAALGYNLATQRRKKLFTKEADQPTSDTRKVLTLNIIILAGFITLAATLIDFFLANTEIFNEIDWYLPPKDLIVSKRHLEGRQEATNEYGFVDVQVEAYDKPARCKIAVLGDSFIWGWGTRPGSDEAWSRQLEKKIPECRVFHWGQGGWSTSDQARFMNQSGNRHQLDLVVLGFVDNDLGFREKDAKSDKDAVDALVKSLKGTPMVVKYTPWDGREEHQAKFTYAKRLFDSHGIKSKNCLKPVQGISGINLPASRKMWSGNHVDSHPGYPITKAIAECAHRFLRAETLPGLGIKSN